MTSVTTTTPGTVGNAASVASGGSNTAGSTLKGDLDSFLRLLTTQLKHQDPLQPTDSTQFVTQLAMFSQAEQAVNTNRHLAGIADMVAGRALADAANLIGKEVVATSEQIAFDGKSGAKFTYTAPVGTTEIKVEILDAEGRVIRSVEGEALPGYFEDAWDGATDAGGLAAPGVYKLRVTAEVESDDAQSTPQVVETQIYGRVEEMRMSDGKVVALINGQEVPYEKITGVGGRSAASSVN